MADPDPLMEALDHAKTVCAQRGARLTDSRRRVLEALLAAPKPVKAYDLLPMLGAPGAPAKPATAYRALDFLQNMGLAHRVAGLNAYVACDYGGGSHVTELFICEACGIAQERCADANPDNTPEGFVVARSVLEHYGTCGQCANTRATDR